MMPGMNPKQMGKMMAQMGITQKQIDASKVTISLGDKDLVIDNPQVVEVTMQGMKTYQVVGEAREQEKAAFTDDDVSMVAEQTGKTADEARAALKKTKGDIAEAIVSLQ
jgi:nascent polypeptide-associated complex subunit alpha